MKFSTLRSTLETALAGRVPSPFTYRDRRIAETVAIGVPEIDSLAGGFPRGSLTEIFGPPCSGHMSMLLAALASRTGAPEACALVDSRDSFDPYSAAAAGVELKNLLWVRCHTVDQSLRATDLLLQGGGFGLVALDLSDLPSETVRHIPLHAWFRFRRIVENTPTIFLLLEQEPNAKTCASLVLRLGRGSPRWSAPAENTRQNLLACLLHGFEVHAEVVRSRFQPLAAMPGHDRFATPAIDAPEILRDCREAAFTAQTIWGHSGAATAAQESPSTAPC